MNQDASINFIQEANAPSPKQNAMDASSSSLIIYRHPPLNLLLLDNNTPLVVLAAVHDVHEPVLDDVGVIADLALGHGDIDVDAAEVDFGDWGDEELFGVSNLILVHTFGGRREER